MLRYQKNGIITENEQHVLKEKKVLVAGCGGLGGYLIEMLSRLGIGNFTVVDGDVFDQTNLNRQLLSNVDNVGSSKAKTAYERILKIDPLVNVTAVDRFIDESNVDSLVLGHDIVVDALDSNTARSILIDSCKKHGIVYIYGAIAGWYGQVGAVYPEDEAIRSYVKNSSSKGVEVLIGNPSFTPACIASFQVSQVLKVLLDREGILRDKLLYVDMLENEFQIIDLT